MPRDRRSPGEHERTHEHHRTEIGEEAGDSEGHAEVGLGGQSGEQLLDEVGLDVGDGAAHLEREGPGHRMSIGAHDAPHHHIDTVVERRDLLDDHPRRRRCRNRRRTDLHLSLVLVEQPHRGELPLEGLVEAQLDDRRRVGDHRRCHGAGGLEDRVRRRRRDEQCRSRDQAGGGGQDERPRATTRPRHGEEAHSPGPVGRPSTSSRPSNHATRWVSDNSFARAGSNVSPIGLLAAQAIFWRSSSRRT